MIFMCKFMHLAHIANKTRVDHDNILGIIISMLRVNVKIKKGCSSHWTLHKEYNK
jgi:hypothetical protein